MGDRDFCETAPSNIFAAKIHIQMTQFVSFVYQQNLIIPTVITINDVHYCNREGTNTACGPAIIGRSSDPRIKTKESKEVFYDAAGCSLYALEIT